jgi:predicted nuclease with TOPRIM domain
VPAAGVGDVAGLAAELGGQLACTRLPSLGELLGQLRDTQREHDSDAAGRLAAENSRLKQRLRDLTASNRTLEERLQAARSNNRFLDKRIADLEAQLLNAEAD